MQSLTDLHRPRPITNRDQLRHATQAAHTEVEGRWFTFGSFNSRSSYDHWLSSLYSAHASLGAAAVKASALRRYAEREAARRDALMSDLGASQTDRPEAQPVSAPWAWGVLYALHGSALGASILLKSNAVQPGWPRRYLVEMREFAASGQLKEFFRALNAASADVQGMAKGAHAVFDLLASSE